MSVVRYKILSGPLMTIALPARLRNLAKIWQKLFRLLRFSSHNLSILVAVLSVVEATCGITVLYLVKPLVDHASANLDAGVGAENGVLF